MIFYRSILTNVVVKELLIGFGNMGRLHARVTNKLGVLGGIVEPSEKARSLADREYDVPTYQSLDEVEFTPDGIIIAVPTKFHLSVVEQIQKKFERIKAVLLEKPVASDLHESRKVAEILQSMQVKTLIGHIEVFNPVVSKFIELIKSGHYGKVRTFTVSRKGAVPIERLGSLSGVLEDLGVHDFDILSRFVNGSLRIYSTGIYKEDSLNSALISISGDNFHGMVHLSREFAGKERKITIECEKSTFNVDLIAQTIEIRALGNITSQEGVISIPHGPGSSIKVYGEPLLEEHLNFLDVINGRAEPLVNIDNGLRVMEFVDASIRSLQSHQPVNLLI
ncbi:MAG: gfo/Idh/MocA family oxidoreductase [Methanobacteriota archaeon]|nr:MAG: gfo/Idh/MocA family oxidoreductase [Euryarchaeota archaeon]